MLALAGLMPLHITLKKLFKRSLIRNGTLHSDHPILSLLDRKHSKGSALHPNSLNRQSATRWKSIRSPLDQVTIHDVQEKFDPLSEHVKPGSRFIDLHPDRIDFSPPPKGLKNVIHHHEELTTLPQNDDTLHFITGWSAHKFEANVPVNARLHSHSSFVAIHNGKLVLQKTRPAGRHVTEETVIGWGVFLALIKAYRKLEADSTIKKVCIYTTVPKVIQNLVTMSTKPTGSTLSMAVSLAFHDIITEFPLIDIAVKGFYRKRAACKCDSFFPDICFGCNMTFVFDNALNARNFGGRQAFLESAPYSLARRGITQDSIAIWHDGFDNENNWSCYHGHGWLDLYDVVGNCWQRALPTHVNQGPWLCSYNGITVANSPGLCGRLVHTATKHALIGEFRLRSFPGKPPEDLHGSLHAPETRDHILNSCSWYVHRANHYQGGIDTIPGLILFLCDNPTAFSFDPTDCP
jgi:hypothetical protein